MLQLERQLDAALRTDAPAREIRKSVSHYVSNRPSHIVAGGELGEGKRTDMFMRRIYAVIEGHLGWELNVSTKTAMLEHQYVGGRRMGRRDRVPFGLCVDAKDDSRLVPDYDEERTIAIILELHGQGLGVRAICTRLDRAGVPRRGKTWKTGQSTVVAVLKRIAKPKTGQKDL